MFMQNMPGNLFDPYSDLRNRPPRPNLERTQAPAVYDFGLLPRDLFATSHPPIRCDFWRMPRYSTISNVSALCDSICDSLTSLAKAPKGAAGSARTIARLDCVMPHAHKRVPWSGCHLFGLSAGLPGSSWAIYEGSSVLLG
jgi:hypothetical protein